MSGTAFRIDVVDAAAVRPLRSEVLRPGVPPERLVYEGDDVAGALHLAARDRDGDVQGIASLAPEPAPHRAGVAAWRLRGMATNPSVRGAGLGRRLLRACFAHVRDQGGGLLWCNARVVALGFYEKMGLHCEGEPFELPGIGPHYVMSRWLAQMRPAHRDEAAVLGVEVEDIDGGGRHHVVATVAGELAGQQVLAPALDGVVVLESIGVRPAWVGCGIGRELFEHARDVAARLGASQLRIACDPDTDGFFRHFGAIADDRPEAAPGGGMPSRLRLDLG